MTQYDAIVRGGLVVMVDNVIAADVAIADGRVVEIAPDFAGTAADEIDARGLHVLPGAIDIHVHFNEPGRTNWEGWATGSLACAVGGTTTVVDMPLNAHPPTLDAKSFDAKLEAAEASSLIDFALWGGLTPHNLGQMEELAARGVVGFKAFMCISGVDDFPAVDDGTLYEGMKRAAALCLPVAVHAENEGITSALAAEARATHSVAVRDYIAARPPIAEVEAISRAILFAEETGCALHVVHVSTARGAAMIGAARARGVDVTGETCPHYLWFSEDDLESLGPLAKCAPPLRLLAEVESLWQALIQGELQIVASDHSPCPEEMKTGIDFFEIWGGIPGCQTLLAALLTAGHEGHGLPLPLVMNLLSDVPARRLRLSGKGRIAPGYDADLILVDMAKRFTLEPWQLRYRHQSSPFAGLAFRGPVRRTMVRGQTVVLDGEVVALPTGQLLTPVATIAD
jgi:allantoinase